MLLLCYQVVQNRLYHNGLPPSTLHIDPVIVDSQSHAKDKQVIKSREKRLKSYNILGHAFLQGLNLSQRNVAAYDALQFRLAPPPQRAITSSPKKVKARLCRLIFRLQPINGQTVIVI